MAGDSKFKIQLLETVGTPLMASIDKVVEGGEVEAAQVMAQLLGQVTQISMKLYAMLEIKEAENQVDTTRLALATLVTPLVAESYEHHKQLLSEDQIKRIDQALEAVISFGENFSSASDHQTRLQTVGSKTVLFDKEQPSLVVLQAMVPVISVVSEFSFGQGERKLIQDVAIRLEREASGLAQKNGNADKLQELIIFKVLAALYASCHHAEIERISNIKSTERGELSLDPIWDSFQIKSAMVETLVGLSLLDSEGSNSESAPVAPAQEKTTEQTPASPASGAGPMGFFKKEEDKSPAVSSSEALPATMETVDQPPKSDEGEAPSSPMGFFKPEAQKKEEE